MASARSTLTDGKGRTTGVSAFSHDNSICPRSTWGSLTRFSFETRVISLHLLLLMEVLWLTVRFDVGTLNDSSGLWANFFRFAPRLSQLVIALVTAACLTGKTRLKQHWTAFAKESKHDREWPHWLFFHVISFIMLSVVSGWLFSTPASSGSLAGLISIEWILLIGATSFCWLAAIGPLSLWGKLLQSEMRAIAVGGVVAAGSVALTSSAQSLWEPLGDLTLNLVAALLTNFFPDVIVDPSIRLVGTARFCVEIAPQCSGYEGMTLILLFLAAFTFLFRNRLRFPNAWLLWPIGMVAIWICNSLRITALIAVGTLISPSVAMGGFHSQGGWIFFNAVSLLISWAALRTPFFTHLEKGQQQCQTRSPAVSYLAPFLVLMALNLVVAAFTGDFEWAYPVKILGTTIALIAFAPAAGYRDLLTRGMSTARAWKAESPLFSADLNAVMNGLIMFAIWIPMIMLRLPPEQRASGMPDALLQASPMLSILWIFSRIFGSVIIVPLVEELAFRGYLMRRLVTEKFDKLNYRSVPWWSILVSSVLFGLMHQAWEAGTLAGMAYALASRQRNSLKDAVVAHAVTNGLICIVVLTCDAWWLW